LLGLGRTATGPHRDAGSGCVDAAASVFATILAIMLGRSGWSLVLPVCVDCACETEDPNQPSEQKPRGSGVTDVEEISIFSHPPKARLFSTYSSAPDQPLLGVPIREGVLWHLSTQDHFELVTFHLYVNGFAFMMSDGREASVSLSPFSLVRNCRFQSGECAKLKSFKVSLLDREPCCYFAVRGSNSAPHDTEAERSDWVLGLSHTVLLIIDSLLPHVRPTCDPLPNMPHTRLRLLAGYLVHRDDPGTISILFCELHAHSGHFARMLVYANESCEGGPLMNIIITASTVCCDIIGINCSSFVLDCHHFAAQTPSERKLWLRALSNVKVKLQNDAPEPTFEELEHFRMSIREQIQQLGATSNPRISSSALLARGDGKTLRTVIDDDVDEPDALAEIDSGSSSKRGPKAEGLRHVIL